MTNQNLLINIKIKIKKEERDVVFLEREFYQLIIGEKKARIIAKVY